MQRCLGPESRVELGTPLPGTLSQCSVHLPVTLGGGARGKAELPGQAALLTLLYLSPLPGSFQFSHALVYPLDHVCPSLTSDAVATATAG